MAAHYFIAIPLSNSIQEFFSRWQDDLIGKLPYKQWPHQEDLHITLKFLGPVADNRLMVLNKELVAMEKTWEFSIQVGGIGTFGNPKKPRVLWAGVEKTEALTNLYKIIEELSTSVGFRGEGREFRPHITLAKKWVGDDYVPVQEITKDFTDSKIINVTEFVIYKIHPGQSPKYEVIEKYMLKRDD